MAGSKSSSHDEDKTTTSFDKHVYSLEWTELSKADYENLEGSQRVFVDKALDRIRCLGMQVGTQLTGELAGCRKLKHRKLGLRIVFRQSSQGIEIVQIVAIGTRRDFKVYLNATKRI